MLDAVSARQIAMSGIRAQRVRMNVIANNIANAETTRTPEGGAFRRQLVVLRGDQMGPGNLSAKAGVRVKRIVRDMESPMRTVFDPAHPDANAAGYVEYPNVNVAMEMVNLLVAQRAYEANVAVLVSGTRMHEAALQILQQ
jgi:flagellar basal-body rod protein FlgC